MLMALYQFLLDKRRSSDFVPLVVAADAAVVVAAAEYKLVGQSIVSSTNPAEPWGHQ